MLEEGMLLVFAGLVILASFANRFFGWEEEEDDDEDWS